MSRTERDRLVTRPLDELAGRIYVHPGGVVYSTPSQNLSVAVGAREQQVLLTVAETTVGPAIELHLSPTDALELAHRLLRMAAAVHDQSSTPRPHA